jgi:hypothetical protein
VIAFRAALRHPGGLRLWLAEVPGGARLDAPPPLLPVCAGAADGVALLVARGPAAELPALRLALTDAAGRLITQLRLPDPPRGDPSAALAAAPPALGLALLSAAAALPQGWLAAWADTLPAAAGEALAAPSGEVLVWLPDGGDLAAGLPLGGPIRPAAAEEQRLPAGRGVLIHGWLPATPEAVLVRTPGGLARLRPAPATVAALASTVEEMAHRLTPEAAVHLTPEASRHLAPEVGHSLTPEAAAGFAAGVARARASRAAAAEQALAALAGGADPARPRVLLLAGIADDFARRLLFLGAAEIGRQVSDILLFGPDAATDAAWLAGRLPVPVRAAMPLAEAARRTALAQATLLPAGPRALAAALAGGEVASLQARALPGAALGPLVTLAGALGDDEAAVLRLAGDAA